jgi:hypothetical protein
METCAREQRKGDRDREREKKKNEKCFVRIHHS